MKTTIIPAQITTVEDRIAGNLGFNQILLLIMAFATAVSVYALVPPRTGWSYEKLVLMLSLAGTIASLAIRIKQRIVLDWIRVISAYMARPRWYVANKNSAVGRKGYLPAHASRIPGIQNTPLNQFRESLVAARSRTKKPKADITHARIQAHHLINHTRGSVRIVPNKGGLHVELG